jgi:hypothetical protein
MEWTHGVTNKIILLRHLLTTPMMRPTVLWTQLQDRGRRHDGARDNSHPSMMTNACPIVLRTPLRSHGHYKEECRRVVPRKYTGQANVQ